MEDTAMSSPMPASKIFRWVRLPAHATAPVLPRNDGLVLPTGQTRYFTAHECQKILALANKYPATVASTGDGGNKVSYSSRNTMVSTLFPDPETIWIFDKLEAAVEKLMDHFRFDVVGFYEGAQLYRYPTNGYFRAHMDIGKGHTSTRKLGITVQLSEADTYEGGDLEFIDSAETAPRELGTIVIFPTYMMHCVRPVIRGERLSLVSWVHGPAFR